MARVMTRIFIVNMYTCVLNQLAVSLCSNLTSPINLLSIYQIFVLQTIETWTKDLELRIRGAGLESPLRHSCPNFKALNPLLLASRNLYRNICRTSMSLPTLSIGCHVTVCCNFQFCQRKYRCSPCRQMTRWIGLTWTLTRSFIKYFCTH